MVPSAQRALGDGDVSESGCSAKALGRQSGTSGGVRLTFDVILAEGDETVEAQETSMGFGDFHVSNGLDLLRIRAASA